MNKTYRGLLIDQIKIYSCTLLAKIYIGRSNKRSEIYIKALT